jgi:hypothetical protein
VAKKKQKQHQPPKNVGPKVLLFDIETAPILAHVWGLWDNNVALNQVVTDWHVMSWSAKWLGAPATDVMYMDQRNAKNIEDDTKILESIWDLLNEADIVITQNGKNFDQKKLFARFIIQGIRDGHPPGTFKHIDTKQIASKHFGFISNKLEYMTEKLNTQYKKLKHNKFPGHEMWTQCLKGNIEAWEEMETYNKHDVLALEELYNKLIPWDNSINFNLYHDEEDHICKCGSTTFIKNGFYYTSSGKFQKHKCKKCGAEHRDKQNLFTKEKRASLKMPTPKS